MGNQIGGILKRAYGYAIEKYKNIEIISDYAHLVHAFQSTGVRCVKVTLLVQVRAR